MTVARVAKVRPRELNPSTGDRVLAGVQSMVSNYPLCPK